MIRRSATASLFAATLLAGTAARANPPVSPFSPRLASPAARSVVSPGETVRIAIAGAPAGAQEWEAFLSLDGGRSYPLRVTPHLPIGEPSFPWMVPSLPSGDARVKIRFGVGGAEREFVLGESFSIAGRRRGALVAPDRSAIGASPAAGEEGTVAWVDGDGDRARLVVPIFPAGLEPARRWEVFRSPSFPVPRRGPLVSSAEPAAERAREPRPLLASPAPLGRSVASLSRLNV